MKTYKILACILACILMISIIPALSECASCGNGTGCRTSQFSTACRYNCSCHRTSSCINTTPSVSPDTKPSAKPTATPSPTIDSSYSGGTSNSSLETEIIRQVNAERAKHGLNALTYDAALGQAAYIRAQEIVKKFSHTRPDGSSWNTVSSSAKGENIAKGYNTADKVMAAWLTSDGHRANILRSGFTTIGVCAFEYNGIMYWVQLFGTK